MRRPPLALVATRGLGLAVVLLSGVALAQKPADVHGGEKVKWGMTPGFTGEFAIPTSSADVLYICLGPDGNLWFTEHGNTANKIGKITPAGSISEYGIRTGGAAPWGICAGPDGNLWFCDDTGHKVWRYVISTNTFTAFTGNGLHANAEPEDICVGSDGNLWLTSQEVGVPKIYKLTTAGVFTEYASGFVTTNSHLRSICAGPDGNLWFTGYAGLGTAGGNRIGKITTSGVVTEYPLSDTSNYGKPFGICVGPDGNLWFTVNGTPGAYNGFKIGRITPAGVITEVVGGGVCPSGIALGPGGTSLWVAEQRGGNGILRFENLAGPHNPPTN